ncbi:MAG TPA: ThuA domain-containing protein [Thermoguttaceae bacterium]|nr:ThuA domain-containing protein [Thermoguttaceae bacterium]
MADSNDSRRKYFVHSAHRTIGVSAGWAALQACDLSGFVHHEERPRPIRVGLLCGALAYFSDGRILALRRHLEAHGRVTCEPVFGGPADDPTGMEDLDACDCLVLIAELAKIDQRQLRRVREHCRRGGAVIGVRTAGHGSPQWPEMETEIFGGDYRGDCANDSTEVEIVQSAGSHPVLAGVEPFVSPGSLQKNPRIVADATLLLTGGCPGHVQPVAWTRLNRGSRVFYTSLGHEGDFRQTSFLRLLANAVSWACEVSGLGE